MSKYSLDTPPLAATQATQTKASYGSKLVGYITAWVKAWWSAEETTRTLPMTMATTTTGPELSRLALRRAQIEY